MVSEPLLQALEFQDMAPNAKAERFNHEAQAWRAKRGTACKEPKKLPNAKIKPRRLQNVTTEHAKTAPRILQTAKVGPKSIL